MSDTRATLAEVLTTLDGVNVRPRKAVKNPKIGDGWITLGSVKPSGYRGYQVELGVIINLGADADLADQNYETLAIDLIEVVTLSEILTADVAVEPVTLVTDGGGSLNALTLTLLCEVENC